MDISVKDTSCHSSAFELLPHEIIEDILSFAGVVEFLRLWQSGSINLRNRLKLARSLAFEWNGSTSLVWPSALWKLVPQLVSLAVSNHPSIPLAKVRCFELATVPKSLQSLTLCFVNCLDIQTPFSQMFPTLTYLHLKSSSVSQSTPFQVPPSLLHLILDCPGLSGLPPLQTLLDQSPNLTTLSVAPSLKIALSEAVRWPSSLEKVQLWISMFPSDRSEQPSQYISFGQEFPPALTHLTLTVSMPISAPPQESFPFHLLPASLTFLSYFGHSAAPTVLPPKLEVLMYSCDAPFEVLQQRTREIWRIAPPSLRICKTLPQSEHNTCTTILKTDLETGIVPTSLERISISPTFSRLPPLPPRLTGLYIDAPSQGVIEDPQVVLPPTMRELALKRASGPFFLLWDLPAGLTSLDFDRYLFSPTVGARGLPRKLTHLGCSNVSFTNAATFADFPPYLTSLHLTITTLSSYLPGNSNREYPMANLMRTTSAGALPKHLQILTLVGHKAESEDPAHWLSDLSPTQPLTDLTIVNLPAITKCEAFYKLPPSLVVLITPITHFSGRHFELLPRGLRTLELAAQDYHHLDTKREHIKNLPRGLVILSLAVPKDINDTMFYNELPLLYRLSFLISGS